MRQTDFIQELYEMSPDISSKAAANRIVRCVTDIVYRELLNHNPVHFASIGTFSVQNTVAREIKNPQTGELISIPSHNTVRFKPAASLRKNVW